MDLSILGRVKAKTLRRVCRFAVAEDKLKRSTVAVGKDRNDRFYIFLLLFMPYYHQQDLLEKLEKLLFGSLRAFPKSYIMNFILNLSRTLLIVLS